MAKSNSINEYTNIEAVELFITDVLSRGRSVTIPGFGYLELKTLNDRRTVLYKSTDESKLSLQLMSTLSEKEKEKTNAIYSIISIPLLEEKVVNLPKVGVFRPSKRENGKMHVSFTPSSSLRKLLNEERRNEGEEKKAVEVTESKETVEIKEKEETAPPAAKSVEAPAMKVEIQKKTLPPQARVNAKVGDVIVPQDNFFEDKRSKNISGILLFIVAVLVIALVVVLTMNSIINKKADGQNVEIVSTSESVSLTTLAERHYGHPAFWIYIYQENVDKLSSPVNIPRNVSLVIPDLKAEYDVNITDTMEIRRAIILGDIVLKERINKITKK